MSRSNLLHRSESTTVAHCGVGPVVARHAHAVAPPLLVRAGRHLRGRAGERALTSALVSWCEGCARRDAPLEDWP